MMHNERNSWREFVAIMAIVAMIIFCVFAITAVLVNLVPPPRTTKVDTGHKLPTLQDIPINPKVP